MTNVTHSSDMKVTGSYDTSNVVVEREFAVDRNSQYPNLVDKRNASTSYHDASILVGFCDLLASSVTGTSVFVGFSNRSFWICQVVTVLAHAERFMMLSGTLVIAMYS